MRLIGNWLALRSRVSLVRRAAKGRGFTLPEALTATVVLSLVIGTVSQIYMGSLQAWYRGSTEGLSQEKAAWVIQRMAPDLQEGMSVTPGTAPFDSCYLAIQLPAKVYDSGQNTYLNQIAVNGYGQPYLVPGNYVVLYRGDAAGHLDIHGTRIWRRLAAPDGSVLKQYEIADNVVDNPVDPATGNPKANFRYWPDVYRLRSVEVTVTVQEKQGSRTSSATMNGELTLRNR
jgi:hypothetical protein